MERIQRFTSLLLALPLAACINTQAELDAWHGATVDDLVLAYGSPDSETILSGGGRLVEYDRTSQYKGTDYPCRIWFVLSPQERVETGHSKGACGLDVIPRQALRSSP